MASAKRLIKAVTFDVGDTLIYPAISRADAFAKVACSYGHCIESAQVEPLVPRMNAYLAALTKRDSSFNADEVCAQAINIAKYEYLCEQLGITVNRTEVACGVQEVYQMPDSWQLFDGATETLAALEGRGFRLAVISNWTQNLEEILQALGLSRYFDEIIVSTVVHLYKPQPEIFHLAAQRLGVEPCECLHVGDSVHADINGATSAGFRPVLFCPTGISRADPAPTITALSQLPSCL
jgi:putative hydrolase of the HAD superfamily